MFTSKCMSKKCAAVSAPRTRQRAVVSPGVAVSSVGRSTDGRKDACRAGEFRIAPFALLPGTPCVTNGVRCALGRPPVHRHRHRLAHGGPARAGGPAARLGSYRHLTALYRDGAHRTPSGAHPARALTQPAPLGCLRSNPSIAASNLSGPDTDLLTKRSIVLAFHRFPTSSR